MVHSVLRTNINNVGHKNAVVLFHCIL